MARVGVVGHKGFIGTILSQTLKSRNHEVIGIGKDNYSHFLNNQLESLTELDDIVWCASLTNPSTAKIRPDLVEKELYDWTSFLSRLSKFVKVSPRIIFISSGGCVYSEEGPCFSELDVARGNNEYGRLKSSMEFELESRNNNYVILRASNIYGPGQSTGRGQGVIAEWIEKAMCNMPITLFGDMNKKRDYLYVDDFVRAVDKIISSNQKENLVLNIGSGRSHSLEEVMMFIQKASEIDFKIHHEEARSFDRPSYWLDVTLAKQKLGWSPSIDLEEGIAKCVDFRRKQVDLH